MNDNLSFVKKNFINYIDKLIVNKKISHTYLIEVDNYDSDFDFVKSFIKMILCDLKFEDLTSSNNEIINLIDSNNYPDLFIIEPDGSSIKKAQLINLQKEFSNKSFFASKRVYVIKNAEKLNSSSANTILKFLEEPENDIIALLLTDNRYHVIDTILSRCQVLSLREDKYDFICEGDIYNLLECLTKPKEFFLRYNYFINNVILDRNAIVDKFKIIENILINYLNSSFDDIIISDNDVRSILKDVSTDKILNIISVIENNIDLLDYNVNYKLWLDSVFSKLIIGG